MRIHLIAIGKNKNTDPTFTLFETYKKRLSWDLRLHELTPKKKSSKEYENQCLQEAIPKDSKYLIALDETGKNLTSPHFSQKMESLQNNGQTPITFLIGGAEGLTHETRKRANMLLSLGQMTWPHMLARTLLTEQLYRAQQILKGHPYHKS